MEKADESVSTCVCVHVPFTTMCVGVRVYVSLKGVSEASMSAAKRQNTLRMFLFTTASVCKDGCMSFRGLVSHCCRWPKDKTHLACVYKCVPVYVCLCFARS